MTQSIDRSTRESAMRPQLPDKAKVRRSHLVAGIRAFTGLTLLAGLVCVVCMFTLGGWRYPLAALGFLILATQSATVLAVESLLSSRESFYWAGHLSGWHRGWRGMPPEAGDPILRHDD